MFGFFKILTFVFIISILSGGYLYISNLQSKIELLKANSILDSQEIIKLNDIIKKQNESLNKIKANNDILQKQLIETKFKAKEQYKKVDLSQSCEKILADKLNIFLERIKWKSYY